MILGIQLESVKYLLILILFAGCGETSGTTRSETREAPGRVHPGLPCQPHWNFRFPGLFFLGLDTL